MFRIVARFFQVRQAVLVHTTSSQTGWNFFCRRFKTSINSGHPQDESGQPGQPPVSPEKMVVRWKTARSRNGTAVGDFEAYTSLRKNSCAVRQVAALNSSNEQFLTCATVSEISFTNAGSQR